MKTLMALFLVGVAFASGYIVGTVQHAPPRPAEITPAPCTFWGLMQHNPHGKKCPEES